MMEWESLWAVVGALVLWRLVACVALAVLLAALMFVFAPSASPVWTLGIVLVGFTAGMVWQTRAEEPHPGPCSKVTLSSPAACLGLAFVGLVWGGLLERATGSVFFALSVLLATPFLSNPLVVALTRRALTAKQLVWGALALSWAYAALCAWALLVPHLST